MKKLIILAVFITILLASCNPFRNIVNEDVAGTVSAFTPIPTQTAFATHTPYPTLTPEPTIAVTRAVVMTPTNEYSSTLCKPMEHMDYSNNTNAILALQTYVGGLPDVRQASYTINERLYSNSLSHLVHVTYVAEEDGAVYSKRYIVYLTEFSWYNGVFSIDGQCWIDGPHR